MKAETKAKIKTKVNKAKAAVKGWTPWFIICAALGITVDSLAKSQMNYQDIKRIDKEIKNHDWLIDQHACAGNHLVQRVNDLEEQNKKLLEESIKVTEGESAE